MLAIHSGRSLVRPGVYVDFRSWDIVLVGQPFGRLPSRSRYVEVPVPLAVLFGPVIGLVYVFSLPLAFLGAVAALLLPGLRAALRHLVLASAGLKRRGRSAVSGDDSAWRSIWEAERPHRGS